MKEVIREEYIKTLKDVKKGDMIGYESTPVKAVVAIGRSPGTRWGENLGRKT